MVAPHLICSTAIHIESNPVTQGAFKCRAVCGTDTLILALDRCCVHWLAECPVISISICLAARLALDAVAGNVVGCAHYRMPLSGLNGCCAFAICWRWCCHSSVCIALSHAVARCIASSSLGRQSWKIASMVFCVICLWCLVNRSCQHRGHHSI